MKHPRCFPKFARCSPTASAWCAVVTRPLRYISQNQVCEFCFVSNFRPSKHCFEKCTAKSEQQPHTTGRSWQTPSGLEEAVRVLHSSFFRSKIPICSNSHFRGKMPVFYFGPDSHLFEIPFVREGTVNEVFFGPRNIDVSTTSKHVDVPTFRSQK